MTLVKRVARALYPTNSVRRVLLGPAKGCAYVVQPGMAASYALGRGLYADFFPGRVLPGMTVYDVGANKGQMALIFSRLVGARGHVLALEPARSQFAILERNLALNRISTVEALCAAASDADGSARFVFAPEYDTQGKLDSDESAAVAAGATAVQVPTFRLDTLLAEGRAVPDLIKIDVEGGLAPVLRGARGLLGGPRAPLVYVELHGIEEQAAVRDELIARGYAVYTLEGEPVRDPTAAWRNPLWCTPPRVAPAA